MAKSSKSKSIQASEHQVNEMGFPCIPKLDHLVESEELFNSYTFFVRDALTNELRLASMNGINHPESLDGFFLPAEEESRLALAGGTVERERREFFTEPDEAHLVASSSWTADHSETLQRLYEERRIKAFAPFSHRENIESCLRFQFPKSEPRLVLFANLNSSNASDELVAMLDEVFAELIDDCDRWASHSRDEFEKAYAQTFQILRPIQQLAQIGCQSVPIGQGDGDRLTHFFDSLLATTLEALNISSEEGFGAIHLFDQETESLELVACTCDASCLKRTLNADEGEGIVSWAALKRKALVINNLQDSIFNEIRDKHEDFVDATRQMVVPMFAAEHLLGVVNIETRREEEFTRQDLYSVSYAAKEAAIAYKFAKQVQRAKAHADRSVESERRIKALLDIAESATAGASSRSEILDELANLLKEWDGFDRAEIWLRSFDNRPFHIAGGSYPEFCRDVQTRKNGWTDFIYANLTPVWIDEINSEEKKFRARIWSQKSKKWRKPTRNDKAPSDLHRVVYQDDVVMEFGIPISSHGKCLGVVWLKKTTEPTSDETFDEPPTEKLANQTAVVLNALRANERQREEDELDQATRTIAKDNFPIGELNRPGMSGYLLYAPYEGRIGGDLCLETSTKAAEWGFLLGDVVGHGYRAALKMLPLMTAFQIHQKESSSPKYVLEQLAEDFSKNDVQFGTAICFSCFHQTDPNGEVTRRFISAATAGHSPLIVFRGNENHCLPQHDGVGSTTPLGLASGHPFGEETFEIKAGDLIVGYTDGIEEARPNDADSSQFGTRNIITTVLQQFDNPPEEIARGILANAVNHARGQIEDDATILVIRVESTNEED